MRPLSGQMLLQFSRRDLGQLLAERLPRALPKRVTIVGPPVAELDPSAVIVVADDRAVSPDECRYLVDTGHAVIVLAALPSLNDETAYRQAGAHAYPAMLLDIAPLLAAVTLLL